MISELPCITNKCTFPPTLGRTFVLSYVSCRNWQCQSCLLCVFSLTEPNIRARSDHTLHATHATVMVLSCYKHGSNTSVLHVQSEMNFELIETHTTRSIREWSIDWHSDRLFHTHTRHKAQKDEFCQTLTVPDSNTKTRRKHIQAKSRLESHSMLCTVHTQNHTQNHKITKNHGKITKKSREKITRAFLRSTPTKVQVRFFSERLISQWLFKSMFRGQILTRNPATNM